ncbi:MAG: GntR family transcriptional regulator [Anaerolineae bacterium]|nr:MAG: GntR family transcriptional regulator [Anaerolineae bacterium]
MNSARPPSLSTRLHDDLRRLIESTPPGERLLSEPYLAKQLGVSRATLREAMRTFETSGLIHRKQGVGTFVAQPPSIIASGLEVLESIHTLAARMGMVVSMGDYEINQRPPTDQEAAKLDMGKSKNVVQVSWVMLADDRPVAYLVDTLPEDVLNPERLKREFNGSVLDLMVKSGELALTTSKTSINAVAANSEIAKALGIQKRDVLLHFEAQLFTQEGRAIDYSYSYYLPGYFNFHVVRRVGK